MAIPPGTYTLGPSGNRLTATENLFGSALNAYPLLPLAIAFRLGPPKARRERVDV